MRISLTQTSLAAANRTLGKHDLQPAVRPYRQLHNRLRRSNAWELPGDNGVEIETRTGKVVAQHAIIGPPSSFRIQSGRLYAFTAVGHAMSTPQQVTVVINGDCLRTDNGHLNP